MAIEKRWIAIPPRAFTSDGSVDGQINLSETYAFKVKQIVKINATGQPQLTLEVKRVDSDFLLRVGPIGGSIDTRSNISAYTTALGANISADEQQRSNVPEEKIPRQVYEEEPTVAIRTFAVDEDGNPYTLDNPFPVELSDGSINIGTVNAELEVQLTDKDNYPHPGDIHDAVRIGDGTDELAINPDGSINVVVSTLPSGASVTNDFNEISSVPSNSLVSVVSYTAPLGFNTQLLRIEFGGDNVATYEVYVNAALIARRRTWFNGNISDFFEFSSGAGGLTILPGSVVTLKAIHTRPDPGSFEGRIQTFKA